VNENSNKQLILSRSTRLKDGHVSVESASHRESNYKPK